MLPGTWLGPGSPGPGDQDVWAKNGQHISVLLTIALCEFRRAIFDVRLFLFCKILPDLYIVCQSLTNFVGTVSIIQAAIEPHSNIWCMFLLKLLNIKEADIAETCDL